MHLMHIDLIYIAKNGINVCLVAYSNILSSETWEATETRAGISIYDDEKFARDIEQIKDKCDIIIVSTALWRRR